MTAKPKSKTIVYVKFRDANPKPEPIWDCCLNLTPLVEPLGPDDGFLDLTGCGEFKNLLTQLARNVGDTGAKFDSGASSSKLLARIAHNVLVENVHRVVSQKPVPALQVFSPVAGCHCLRIKPGDEPEILEGLPLRFLWQFPDPLLDQLRRLGLLTIGQLRAVPLPELVIQVGEIGYSLHQAAFGIDLSSVKPAYPPRTILRKLSLEDWQFGTSSDGIMIQSLLRRISSELSQNLRNDNWACNKIELSLLTDSGSSRAQRSLKQPSNSPDAIFAAINGIVTGLSSTISCSPRVREIEIRALDLESTQGRQLKLFAFPPGRGEDLGTDPREERLEQTLRSLKRRFGTKVKLGANVQQTRLEKLLRAVESQWKEPAPR